MHTMWVFANGFNRYLDLYEGQQGRCGKDEQRQMYGSLKSGGLDRLGPATAAAGRYGQAKGNDDRLQRERVARQLCSG